MGKVRVAGFGVSLDGFGAGARQGLHVPLGERGVELMQWFFPTQTFQRMHGGQGGTTGVDDEQAAEGFRGVGAWILGRNMFGPIRGGWGDGAWKGWWGDSPPYHVPAFVLTHYEREPLVMEGGTTFYFVQNGIYEALERAREAAAGQDVRVGGGVGTIRQYLQAGLLDEMHLAYCTGLLGEGETLLGGLDLPKLGYRVSRQVFGERAMHVFLERNTGDDGGS